MLKTILFQSLILSILVSLYSNIFAQKNKFEEALSFYYGNEMDKVLEILNSLFETETPNEELYCWIAQANLRLRKLDEAEKYGKIALQINECSSFAHIVVGSAMFQRSNYKLNSKIDSSWIHLTCAVECDSTNCSAWLEIWSAAWGLNDLNMANKAIGKLKETGFLTKPTLAFGRWLLSYLPQNAIIITSGDMDTYPMLALQLIENFRTDVIVIEKEWLDIDWTLRNLKDDYKIPLYFSDEDLSKIYKAKKDLWGTTADTPVMNKWIENSTTEIFNHPIAFSVTVGPDYLSPIMDKIKYCGTYFQLNTNGSKHSTDINILEKSIKEIKTSDYTGSWTSERDLSPIRKQYTKYLVLNISEAALRYADELINRKQFTEAETILN